MGLWWGQDCGGDCGGDSGGDCGGWTVVGTDCGGDRRNVNLRKGVVLRRAIIVGVLFVCPPVILPVILRRARGH